MPPEYIVETIDDGFPPSYRVAWASRQVFPSVRDTCHDRKVCEDFAALMNNAAAFNELAPKLNTIAISLADAISRRAILANLANKHDYTVEKPHDS